MSTTAVDASDVKTLLANVRAAPSKKGKKKAKPNPAKHTYWLDFSTATLSAIATAAGVPEQADQLRKRRNWSDMDRLHEYAALLVRLAVPPIPVLHDREHQAKSKALEQERAAKARLGADAKSEEGKTAKEKNSAQRSLGPELEKAGADDVTKAADDHAAQLLRAVMGSSAAGADSQTPTKLAYGGQPPTQLSARSSKTWTTMRLWRRPRQIQPVRRSRRPGLPNFHLSCALRRRMRRSRKIRSRTQTATPTWTARRSTACSATRATTTASTCRISCRKCLPSSLSPRRSRRRARRRPRRRKRLHLRGLASRTCRQKCSKSTQKIADDSQIKAVHNFERAGAASRKAALLDKSKADALEKKYELQQTNTASRKRKQHPESEEQELDQDDTNALFDLNAGNKTAASRTGAKPKSKLMRAVRALSGLVSLAGSAAGSGSDPGSGFDPAAQLSDFDDDDLRLSFVPRAKFTAEEKLLAFRDARVQKRRFVSLSLFLPSHILPKRAKLSVTDAGTLAVAVGENKAVARDVKDANEWRQAFTEYITSMSSLSTADAPGATRYFSWWSKMLSYMVFDAWTDIDEAERKLVAGKDDGDWDFGAEDRERQLRTITLTASVRQPESAAAQPGTRQRDRRPSSFDIATSTSDRVGAANRRGRTQKLFPKKGSSPCFAHNYSSCTAGDCEYDHVCVWRDCLGEHKASTCPLHKDDEPWSPPTSWLKRFGHSKAAEGATGQGRGSAQAKKEP